MGHDPVHDLAGGGAYDLLVADHSHQPGHFAGCRLAPAVDLAVLFAAGGARVNTGIRKTMRFQPAIDGDATTGQLLAPDGRAIVAMRDHQAGDRLQIGGGTVLEELHKTGTFSGKGVVIDQGLMPGVDALSDLVEDAYEDGDLDYTGCGEDGVGIDGGFAAGL